MTAIVKGPRPEDVRPVAGHYPRWRDAELVCGADGQLWPCEVAVSVIDVLREQADAFDDVMQVEGLRARADELEALHLTGRAVSGG